MVTPVGATQGIDMIYINKTNTRPSAHSFAFSLYPFICPCFVKIMLDIMAYLPQKR